MRIFSIILSFVIYLFSTTLAYTEGSLNTVVAISALSQNINDNVDGRFARCPYFLLVNIENDAIISQNFIKNTYSNSYAGAGIAIAQMLADNNVSAILSENIGRRALVALDQFQIAAYHASGPILDVIQNYIDGKLSQIQIEQYLKDHNQKIGQRQGLGPGQGQGMNPRNRRKK